MTPEELYQLLPALYRSRDEEEGRRLYALLSVIAEQADVVQADIERLYDNWFIETCDLWLVPYLGDLVGCQVLPGTAAAPFDGHGRSWAAAVSRRDVARTVANRRRTGTPALLEDLAAAVAEWPARAVEFRRQLCVTQPVRRYPSSSPEARHRLGRGGLVNVRRIDALDRGGGPFDELAHTVEVARPGSRRRPGRYGVGGVGLHVWRSGTYAVTLSPACCLAPDRGRYAFNVLGIDTQLVTKPVPEPAPCHTADETNVPAPVRRRALAERLYDYYGPGKSLCLWTGPQDHPEPLALDRIVAADLSDWRPRPGPGRAFVDPVLGRLALPPDEPWDGRLWVSYHHAFVGDLGGGEYPRPEPGPTGAAVRYRVGPGREHRSINDALERWRAEKHDHPGKTAALIEVCGNGVTDDLTDLRLDPGDQLTLRATDGSRPVIRLDTRSDDRAGTLRITGTGKGSDTGPPPRVVLDGFLITGGGVQVRGDVGRLTVRHCTLVPGLQLGPDGAPLAPGMPSLEIVDSPVHTEVRHSILGTIAVSSPHTTGVSNPVLLHDSVLDATHRRQAALRGPDDGPAPTRLTARRTTVIGAVHVQAVDVLENCLLDGEVRVARTTEGAVRFCWLPPGSHTPARTHCQPEQSGDPARVALRFAGRRYGAPHYVQLSDDCAEEIRRGADDRAEPGALHDVFRPLREDILRTRLAEYTPAGCDAALFFAT
ncbi:hypothetical protein ACFVFQ_29725 [Streptomyces sp. NPDC057743]|uniref:hypothetical protein n=1 Tax=Streptomyces sp. NPDC057743 TaxID=3346236 RepID=UPI0036D17FDC